MNESDKDQWSEQATLDDIYYCYRLLLGRPPGKDGLEFWSRRLANENFTFSKLAAHFRKSPEYLTAMTARGIKRVTLNDFDIYVYEHDWDTGEYIAATKQYEPQVASFLKQHLKENMTFVDVGANIGFFTMMAARLVGDSGRVIAVECNPKNCELIYMGLRRNGFNNVLVYSFAVSDSQKLMRLTSGFSNGVINELDADAEESLIVPAVTLDFLLLNEPRVDVIKMDIEGSEGNAWMGMQQTIEKHRPLIVMEFFPALLKANSAIQVEDLLSSIYACGYTASIFHADAPGIVKASSPREVMDAWTQQCATVGDESKAYFELVLSPDGSIR